MHKKRLPITGSLFLFRPTSQAIGRYVYPFRRSDSLQPEGFFIFVSKDIIQIMAYIKKNDLLIGCLISVLLSIFVNSSILLRDFGFLSPNIPLPHKHPSDNIFLYFSLIWFFLFSFLLYLINSRIYKIGDKLGNKHEYKTILCAIGISSLVAFGALQSFMIVYDLILTETSGLEEGTQIPGHPPFPFPRPLMTEHLIVLLTILLSVLLIRLLNGKQQMRLEYEKLKSEKLQTSYNALMGQINPHFFFNSLNGLNSLIRNGEKEQTLTYLDELSNVFRYILQSNKKELVTLAEELQFVKAYTYLLSVRYEGKLFFSIQANPPLLLWYLPILSVLPLIENAVKHNVISKQYPLQIDIYTTTENRLVVSNPIQPKIEVSNSSGIGLKNLWGRYRLLTNKDIVISNRKNYFKVSLPLLDGLLT